MPELRVRALIFDMDGGVIDSGDIYAKHWRRWGAQHGYDYDRDIAHVHPGRPPVETVRIVAPHLDPEIEAAACRRIGLEPAPISTQILQRDRHAECGRQ